MHLWQARQKSLEWLTTELVEQNSLVDTGFEILDTCIVLLNQQSRTSNDELNGKFARVVNITLAKSRNLLLGSYSLMLDALAQEAGALLRLILEAYELLIYFRLEPLRVDQAIDGKLPSPGNIAKKIDGKFKGLRDYLSTHASHISFGYESAKHLLNYPTSDIKAIQSQSIDVFKNNLSTLNAVQILVVAEAIRCLDVVENTPEALLKEYEDWRLKSIRASP
ncbi:MAG: hypothetical protein RL536_86 [Candidatus Parcubacteria bacterium]|jgi:hypothetical protein